MSKPLSSLLLFLVAILCPGRALAFQPHEYSGLYIHQLAHFFLIASLFFFAVKAQHSRHASSKGWHSILIGAWLLIIWNMATMGGHFLDLYISEDSLVRLPGEKVPSIQLASWKEVLFYLLKMDNFIAVPAMLFIYRGLSMFRESRPAQSAG
ncbi:hypothetical protein ACUUL3_06635 [Thiovibrio sp. JS02]